MAQSAPVPVAGSNVNMVAGIGRTRNADGSYSYALGDGDPFLTKQNEPSLAVSSLNPLHLMGAANDYRLIPLAQSVVVPGESAGADSWIGIYRSNDGGKSWRSTVLAGCPVAIPQCAGNAALQGLSFASDPTIRPGPYGSFFLSFIAGNRGTGAAGVVGVQRFFDLNNNVKYDDNPFQPDVLNVVDTGTTGQFLDKTWNISDIPRSWNANSTCAVPTSKVPVPAFNVYLSYSNFVGQDPTNPHPQVFVATSKNCGASFAKPVKVSQSTATNQGTVLTVDPVTGTVYVFWRQISTPANGSPDAIYFSKSTDGGNTWSKPALVALITPFEQDSTSTTFRTENFPTAAVDASGRVYVAWSQWGVGPLSPGATQGAARIVITTSSNGGNNWSHPVPVDNNFQSQNVPYAPGPNAPNKSVAWSAFNPYNAAGYGHQMQPTLTFAGGTLTLFWLDQRLDHTAGRIDCSQAPSATNLSQCTEVRDQRPSAGTDPLASVFTDTISDSPGLRYRHTLDVFGGQALPADNPAFNVTRVSQYPFGSQGGDSSRTSKPVRQLQVNPPDLPLFANATTPFLGDYLDVVAQAIVPTGTGGYSWNTGSSNASVVHTAWTDNRDVIAPADGVSWSKYQPIMTLAADGATVTVNPSCLPGYAGSQNQNIYTAEISGGIDAYAVVNSKLLTPTAPRQFNVVVENHTAATKTVSLTLANQPAGGSASFDLVKSLPSVPSLTIFPSSSITRTVWVTSSNPGATVAVNVTDASGNLITRVLLNPDSNATVATAPAAPAGGDVVSVNQSDVTVLGTSLSNTSLTNVDVGVVDPAASDLSANTINAMDLGNMDLGNMDLGNMDLGNMDLGNMDLGNMDLGNMDLGNMDLGNPSVAANTATFMDLGNAGIVDTNYLLFNNSTTTDVSLDLKTLLRSGTNPPTIPPGYKLQIFVHKIYPTQSVLGGNSCSYGKVSQKTPLVNAPGPTITATMDLGNPSIAESWITNPDPTNGSITLLPGEVGHVTYRLISNGSNDQNQNQQNGLEFGTNGIKTVAINQSITVVPIPLIIATNSLADAAAGSPYSTPLASAGGLAPITWSQLANGPGTICPANSIAGLPPGLSVSPTGVLSGVPTAPGLYCFVLQVTDSTAAPHTETDKQTLALIVHGAQSVSLPSGPLVYGSSATLPATSSGGLSITYSVTAGPCSVTGTLITATAGTGTCTVSASNTGNTIYFPLSASQSIPLNPAALTVTANNASMVYGASLPAFSSTFSGLVLTDTAGSLGTITYTTAATAASPVGSYPVTPGGLVSSNYSIQFFPGTLTISPATLTITANNASMAYGGALPAFSASYSGFVNHDTTSVLSGAPSLTTTATSSSSVGSYPIAATTGTLSAANYALKFVPGTLTINAATLTISALPSSKVYGDPLPAFGVGYSGFVLGQNASVLSGTLMFTTATTPTSPVGSYFVTPGGLTSTNYAIVFVAGILNVTKATPVFGNLSSPTIFSGAVPPPIGGNIGYASVFPSGSVSVTLNGSTVSASIAPSTGSFAASFSTTFSYGTYTISYSYPGDANFSAATAAGTLHVSGWTTTGSMLTPRSQFAAVLLQNGKVLMAGGLDAGGNPLASAEVYDPSAGTFSAAVNNMPNKASNFTATLLGSGTVLLAGGGNASAQIYNPATNSFNSTGGMGTQRSNHTATLLPSGLVLIAGGSNNSGTIQNSAQLFDPSTGKFTSIANMNVAREYHTATLLPNGKVLIAGGRTGGKNTYSYLASAEVYDPGTGIFTAVGNMTAARYAHTAALSNGMVLIAGGANPATLSSAELYNPSTGTFTATTSGMSSARQYFTATAISSGVLEAGGLGGSAALASSEEYQGGGFATAGNLQYARYFHSATVLANGSVLVAGGVGSGGASIATAELFVIP